jgi:general secretion pathway protein A
LKEIIKQYLFQQGVDRQKTIILIIDEGQKIPIFCLEVLREFLNYETNEYKLLQIVIFAQKEFEHTIKKYANLADRINLYHYLKPLSFKDTRRMIKYRLEKSSDRYRTYTFFSFPALVAIFLSTGGYPRKIINLCHRCILTMILQNKTVVDLLLVRTCINRVFPDRPGRLKKISVAAALSLIAAAAVFWFSGAGNLKSPFNLKKPSSFYDNMTAAVPAADQPQPLVAVSGTSEPEKNSETMSAENPPLDNPLDRVAAKEETLVDSGAGGFSSDTAGKDNGYNHVLGPVTLRRNETLSGLIKDIYGNFNSRHFRSLILANPQIEDPDVVKVGQTILFPAIPVAVSPPPADIWWVSFGDKDTLEDALQILRTLPKNGPQIRLVPYWNQRNGMKFALLHKKYFYNKSNALKKLQTIKAPYSSQARLVASWDADTVFFADPFFGRRLDKRKRAVN